MMLTILYIVAALDAISFSMVITIMTPYVYSLGGTQLYLGIMGSVTAFITLIWNPIVGSLSDRLGRKKVLLQCLLICLVGNFIVTCTSSLTVFFISRVLAALGTQIMTLIKSLIDDNVKSQDDKMGAINKIQALMGFAFIFGSLISGHLSEYENGMKYIFALISAGFAVNFGLICLIKDAKVERKKQEKQSFNIFKEISLAAQNLRNVNWPKYWDLFVIKLIIDFSFNVFQFNSGLILLKRFGIVGKSFGYVIATMGIIGIATNLAMMTVKRHLYSKDDSGLTRLLHGNILLIITYLGFGLNTNFSLFIAYLVPMSVARTLIEATFTEVLLGRASPDEKGSIMGTFDSTLSLGGLVAPVLSGVIADSWGEDICLLFCVFPLVFGAILTYSQKIKVQ